MIAEFFGMFTVVLSLYYDDFTEASASPE